MTSNNSLAKHICDLYKQVNPSYLDANNILWMFKDGDWIGKPAVQTKSLKIVWLENVAPDDIDNRYYNLNGTIKNATPKN